MNDTNQDKLNFEPIVNKVAQSGLITLSLEDFLPTKEVLALDVKDFLFQGMLLKEKDFREAIKTFDWSIYNNKTVAVYCSTHALIQHWAYMLIVGKLSGAQAVFLGTKNEVIEQLLLQNIRKIDTEQYEDQRVMVRGCGDARVKDAAYLEISKKLLPVVKSLFYGEVCSNVPIYKKAKLSKQKNDEQ